MSAPDIIFIDPRVAARLPGTADEAREGQAQGSADPVGYILEELARKRIREATNPTREIIITIQAVGSILYGLSNHGQLWAQGDVDGVTGWHLINGRDLEPGS